MFFEAHYEPKKSNKVRKFKLLLWKNWLLQWRHKKRTIFEFLAPVIYSIILVIFRVYVRPIEYNSPLKYDEKFPYYLPGSKPWELAWSPKNNLLDQLMKEAVIDLNTNLENIQVSLKPFPSSDDLTAYLTDPDIDNMSDTLAGIEFPDELSNIQNLPNNVTIILRFPGNLRSSYNKSVINDWKTDQRIQSVYIGHPREEDAHDDGKEPGYYREGFLSLQNSISKAIVQMQAPNDMMASSVVPIIKFRRFPFPPFIMDVLFADMKMFISIIVLYSFGHTAMEAVVMITTEKEKQLKEAMKIMGLPNWLHWSAWFSKLFLQLLFALIMNLIVFTVPWCGIAVFHHADRSLLFAFYFCYTIATICFSFMMSVFFTRATMAAPTLPIIWFLSFAIYFTRENKSYQGQQNYVSSGLVEKYLICLLSNSAMGYGFDVIMRHESTGVRLTWHNFMYPLSKENGLHLGVVIIMLLVDSVIYMLLTLYLEQIFPGEYGVPQPWNFPFSVNFWKTRTGRNISNTRLDYRDKSIAVEEPPAGATCGISIMNLTKIHSRNGKVAVDGLSVDMFQDQITILLGQNGAGKSTAMNVLTGMTTPTSGTAYMNGLDIRTNMSEIRNSLGLCPQHNILFDELTVQEHMFFFCRLKGLKDKELKREVVRYMEMLEMEDLANTRAINLSAGQQRKLSVSMALCGGSTIVICDEPTAGMDPAARRALWDLLEMEKQGRTILISTHYMDEADILGDRVAIIADGKLQAVGSPMYLKNKFGNSYQLTIIKEKNCNVNEVTKFLQEFIPTASIATHAGSELTYMFSKEYGNVLEKVCVALENDSAKLNITSYCVSYCTLKEVFTKFGIEKQEIIDEIQQESVDITPQHGLLSGVHLFYNQVYAIFRKSFISARRNWYIFMAQVLIPLVTLVIAILSVRGGQYYSPLPALSISINSYNQTVTILSTEVNFVEDDKLMESIYNMYEHMFMEYSKDHEIYNIHRKDIEEYILKQQSENNLVRVNSNYLVGVSFDRTSITAWFNNQQYHTLPISLNLVYNAILKATSGPEYNIEFINKPLPFRIPEQVRLLKESNKDSSTAFEIANVIGLTVTFSCSFFVLFHVKERVSKAKHLQFVSGIGKISYWVSEFIWDYFTFAFMSFLWIISMAPLQEVGFATLRELGRAYSVLLAFGVAEIPLMYYASFFYDIPAVGMVSMSFFNMFFGNILFTIVDFLKKYEMNVEALSNSFLFLPQYAICICFRNLKMMASNKFICKRLCELTSICDPDLQCEETEICCLSDHPYNNWEDPGIIKYLLIFLITAAVMANLVLMKEFRILQRAMLRLKRKFFSRKFKLLIRSALSSAVVSPESSSLIDDDVLVEIKKVHDGSLDVADHQLVLKDFTKYYKTLLAVNKMCVIIDGGECFGLLGVNGAGKSTTFKMISGDENISLGSGWVNGFSLLSEMKKVHKVIGYCPQFDALIDNLTGRETLTMFCLLRGVCKSETSTLAYKLAQELNFEVHIDKKVKEYSGGNKRKLSTAISLIGNPHVILLDEPTSGMDITTKLHTWNAISNIRDKGCCVILTSNSMEECEALCTRIAIMVNGEFKCIGTQQHLKDKFSKGYTLKIKTTSPNKSISFERQSSVAEKLEDKRLQDVKKYIRDNQPTAVLSEEYHCLLTYYIPMYTKDSKANYIKWSHLFVFMEKLRKNLDIEDYSLGGTTLEQVFMSFARKQHI